MTSSHMDQRRPRSTMTLVGNHLFLTRGWYYSPLLLFLVACFATATLYLYFDEFQVRLGGEVRCCHLVLPDTTVMVVMAHSSKAADDNEAKASDVISAETGSEPESHASALDDLFIAARQTEKSGNSIETSREKTPGTSALTSLFFPSGKLGDGEELFEGEDPSEDEGGADNEQLKRRLGPLRRVYDGHQSNDDKGFGSLFFGSRKRNGRRSSRLRADKAVEIHDVNISMTSPTLDDVTAAVIASQRTAEAFEFVNDLLATGGHLGPAERRIGLDPPIPLVPAPLVRDVTSTTPKPEVAQLTAGVDGSSRRTAFPASGGGKLARTNRTYRKLTVSASRKQPRALIIGVKKGGTRALLEFVRLHPDVRAVGPETHFFDRHYQKGLEWYRRHMPISLDGQMTMEKTPSYFVTREVPKRVFNMSRDVKLLVVVRDPVTRAISDYAQTMSKRPKMKSFDELAFLNNATGLVDTSWAAIKIGVYAKHLERWLQYFPLEQFHFVSGELLIRDPAGEMAKVQDFLGVRQVITEQHFYFNETKGFPCLKKSERNGRPKCLGRTKGRTHPVIDPAVVQRLRDFYRPFNAKFYLMTGINFGWP